MTSRRRQLIAGAVVLGGYVAVASVTLGPGRPLRPLFDGSAPPPAYRWVNPPPELEATNLEPEGEARVLRFIQVDTTEGSERMSEAGTITTPDGQATASIPSGIFVSEPGAESVRVSLVPIDPETIGPPPAGQEYAGNGIALRATLEPSGEDATLVEQDCAAGGCVGVALRFPSAGTELYVHDGETWTALDATVAHSALQVYGSTPTLGTFVVTAAPLPGKSRITSIVAFVAGSVAVVAAVAFSRMRKRDGRRGGPPATGKRARQGAPASGKRGRSGQSKGSEAKRPRGGATRKPRRR